MRFIKYLSIILIASFALPQHLSALPSLQDYTRAIEVSPEDMKYRFYYLRAKVYQEFGEMDLALDDLNISIRLKPTRTAYIYRGKIYFELERYSEAIDDFTAAIDINPSYELYKIRSASYLKSGNYVLALADSLNLIDIAPQEPESYYASMEALENLGDIKLARELAFKVKTLDRVNKKANKFITEYPLKYVFIGGELLTIYVNTENDAARDKATEILLKYKQGVKLDENIKNYLGECSRIGTKIKQDQELLREVWDDYFKEIMSLNVRSRKIHEELRDKFLAKSEAIERETALREKESEECTKKLIKVYQNIRK